MVLKCVHKKDIYLTTCIEETYCWENNSSDEVLTAVLLRIQDFRGCDTLLLGNQFPSCRVNLELLNPEGTAFLQNIWNHSSSDRVWHPRRHEFPRQFSHLDKKLPTVYDTCRFITIFKTSLPLCLPPSQINPFTLPHPIYLRPILTLTSHACLV